MQRSLKENSSSDAHMQGRMIINQNTPISGSMGEVSGSHFSEMTQLNLQSMAVLSEGDNVELQGNFRDYDGYIGANHTVFWGMKVG